MDIKKAIIHVLDREADQPLLNAYELEINEDIQNFLEKHITKALHDEDIRKANFKEGLNIIKNVCFKIGQEPSYFIDGSKEIARQLFKAMKTNSSISSTDLIVCMYQDEMGQQLAILKMDYTTSFIHDIEAVGSQFKITIKKQDISLPGTSQKIQKCAFVNTTPDIAGYDLMVLDNQIHAKNDDEPIAQFFLQTFLSADLLLDSKTCTKTFKKETENWIRLKEEEGELSSQEVRDLVHSVIREEDEIDIQTFSQKAFGTKQHLSEDYQSFIKETGLTEEKFAVDKEWVDRKMNKIRLKTESDIEVILEYENYINPERFEITSNPDGTKNIIIKNVVSLFEK